MRIKDGREGRAGERKAKRPGSARAVCLQSVCDIWTIVKNDTGWPHNFGGKRLDLVPK